MAGGLTRTQKTDTINIASEQRDDRKEYVHPTGKERGGHRLQALLPAAGRKCVRERGGCRRPPAAAVKRDLSDKREWNRGVIFASHAVRHGRRFAVQRTKYSPRFISSRQRAFRCTASKRIAAPVCTPRVLASRRRRARDDRLFRQPDLL